MSHQAPFPPAGFRDPEVGGFVGRLGPIYRRDYSDSVVSGFWVEEQHCNPGGICHGGWLSTFADVAMVRQASVGGARALTVSMALDFLEEVPLGAWVESRMETIRRSSRTVIVQGVATVGTRNVMRISGTFRLVGTGA